MWAIAWRVVVACEVADSLLSCASVGTMCFLATSWWLVA